MFKLALGNIFETPRVSRRQLLAAAFVLVLSSPIASAEVIEGEELKDPTRPADTPLVVAEEGGESFLSGLFGTASSLLGREYTVSFIRAGGREPVAMINEQLVKTGDIVDSAEVVAIDADSVSLRIDGVIQRVASFNNTVKSRAEPQQR